MNAIRWAQNYTEITQQVIKIILTSANSLLYFDGQPWKKKDCNTLFDITMGSFQGAEVCELIGLFILFQLQDVNIDCGLYRDDGLGVTGGTKRQIENTK